MKGESNGAKSGMERTHNGDRRGGGGLVGAGERGASGE